MAGAAGGLLFVGGLIGAGMSASGTSASTVLAATSSTPSTANPANPGQPGGGSGPPAGMPGHGSAAHENAEAAVTGANSDKAKAAAVKAVGGGTAGSVTSDFTKNGYEVTVMKSDGTSVEVHLDSSFNVMQRR